MAHGSVQTGRKAGTVLVDSNEILASTEHSAWAPAMAQYPGYQLLMVLSSFVQTSMDLLHKELQACNNDMFLQTLDIRMAA